MNTFDDLTPKQRKFLDHACAFIAMNPPQPELDKLLTLAAMQLPPQVAETLARRASGGTRRLK